MTTIAYKDGKLCSDSKVSWGSGAVPIDFPKLYNIEGHWYGFAGNLVDIEYVKQYLIEGEIVVKDTHEMEMLRVSHYKKEKLISVEIGWVGPTGQPTFFDITESYMAVGSGKDLAMAAMMAGASAKEAVEIACKLDDHTGGEVIEVDVTVEDFQVEED